MGIIISALSLLGVYSFFTYLPFLLPRNNIPGVAAALNETQRLLDRAETLRAIPDATEYRTSLTM